MHKKGVNMMNSCFKSKEETPTDPIMKDFEEKNMESQCFVLGHRIVFIFMIGRQHMNVMKQNIAPLILKLEDKEQLKMWALNL